jgi:hypothetical protein
MSEKTASDFIDDIAKEPSADKFFDRDPAKMADKDIDDLVKILRADRTRMRMKEQTGQVDGGDLLDPLNEVHDE